MKITTKYDKHANAVYISLNTEYKIDYTYMFNPNIGFMLHFDVDIESYVSGIEIIGSYELNLNNKVIYSENTNEHVYVLLSTDEVSSIYCNNDEEYDNEYITDYIWYKKNIFNKLEIGLSETKKVCYIKIQK